MSEADVIFCGAGGTLLESMTIGLPAVVIPQTEREKNFSFHIKSRASCFLESDITSIESLNFQERELISKNAMSLVDGYGARRVIKVLDELRFKRS